MALFKNENNTLTPTSTLKLSRINVIGKGIRELLSIDSFNLNLSRGQDGNSKRVNQTLAENHPFSVISSGDVENFSQSPKNFIGYLSLFVVNRLEELLNLLQEVHLLVKSTSMPTPYSIRAKRLIVKYSRLLEYELHAIEILWLFGQINQYENKVEDKSDEDAKSHAKKLLEKFATELDNYIQPNKSKKRRLQKIYLKFESELKQVKRLIELIYPVKQNNEMLGEKNIVTHIRDLRNSCRLISSLVKLDGDKSFKDFEHASMNGNQKLSGVDLLVQKRKTIMEDISDESSEISASKILYTRLLTARLISEYQDKEANYLNENA